MYSLIIFSIYLMDFSSFMTELNSIWMFGCDTTTDKGFFCVAFTKESDMKFDFDMNILAF